MYKNLNNVRRSLKEVRWIVTAPALVVGFIYGIVGTTIVLGSSTISKYGDVPLPRGGILIFMLLFGASGSAYYATRMTPIHKAFAAAVMGMLYSLCVMASLSYGMSLSIFISGSIMGLLLPSYIVYKVFKKGDEFRIRYYSVGLVVVLLFLMMYFL